MPATTRSGGVPPLPADVSMTGTSTASTPSRGNSVVTTSRTASKKLSTIHTPTPTARRKTRSVAAATVVASKVTLLTLPTEILLRITELLLPSEIAVLSSCCKEMYGIVIPHLYKDVLLRLYTDKAPSFDMYWKLMNEGGIATYVRHLTVLSDPLERGGAVAKSRADMFQTHMKLLLCKIPENNLHTFECDIPRASSMIEVFDALAPQLGSLTRLSINMAAQNFDAAKVGDCYFPALQSLRIVGVTHNDHFLPIWRLLTTPDALKEVCLEFKNGFNNIVPCPITGIFDSRSKFEEVYTFPILTNVDLVRAAVHVPLTRTKTLEIVSLGHLCISKELLGIWSLKHLRSLTLRCVNNLTNAGFIKIPEDIPIVGLQKLHLITKVESRMPLLTALLERLPRGLRELHMLLKRSASVALNIPSSNMELNPDLIIKHADTLVALTLQIRDAGGSKQKYSTDKIQKIVRGCPKLEELSIGWKINQDFTSSIEEDDQKFVGANLKQLYLQLSSKYQEPRSTMKDLQLKQILLVKVLQNYAKDLAGEKPNLGLVVIDAHNPGERAYRIKWVKDDQPGKYITAIRELEVPLVEMRRLQIPTDRCFNAVFNCDWNVHTKKGKFLVPYDWI